MHTTQGPDEPCNSRTRWPGGVGQTSAPMRESMAPCRAGVPGHGCETLRAFWASTYELHGYLVAP